MTGPLDLHPLALLDMAIAGLELFRISLSIFCPSARRQPASYQILAGLAGITSLFLKQLLGSQNTTLCFQQDAGFVRNIFHFSADGPAARTRQQALGIG